jgi:hypothetical protein
VSELLDRFVPGTGNGAAGGKSGGASAYDRFLGSLIPDDLPSEELSRALLYAAAGSALAIAGGLLMRPLPSRTGVLGSDLYQIGRVTLADLMGTAGAMSSVLIVCGLILLVVTGAVAITKCRGQWAAGWCVTAVILGVGLFGLGILAWLTLLAVVAINVLFWIMVGALIVIGALIALAVIGAVLGGMQ